MKLLLISVKSDTPSGGIAVWTDHFLDRCQKYGIECHLVNTQISQKRAMTGKRSVLDEYLRTKKIFRQLKRNLTENTYDAIYLNTSCGPFGLFRDKKLASIVTKRKIPLITHYHCEIPFWVKRRSSIRCLEHLAHMSSKNLVLCESSKAFLEDHYCINVSKIPNFVENSIMRSSPKKIRPTIQQVFFVGKVTESKGAKELFDVARLLPNVSFTFAGNVSSVVRGWDKPNNVCLLGSIPRDDVLKRLDESDLFLFPSHTEGSSLALIECLARGVPAIATNVGSNADILGDGCGIIVEKEDTAAMLKAIESLQCQKKRKTMSENAIKRAKQKYSDKNVNYIVEALHQLNQETKGVGEMISLSHARYYIARLLNRRMCAIRNSKIHKKASVGNGAKLVNCEIGRYSYIYGSGMVHTKVGSFCSIASKCSIGGGQHPTSWISSSPVFYNKGNVLKTNFANTSFEEYASTIIGNDVWIGAKCLIKGGITIGDGAIVAMGSVVTKDIPPYEIWGGNPAKCIRKRFDDETITKLLELKWWDWDEEKLYKYGSYFNDPTHLFKKLEEDQ